MSLNELIILCVHARAWLMACPVAGRPKRHVAQLCPFVEQHPSPACPPLQPVGLTSPLGTVFWCGQMVWEEVMLDSSSWSPCCQGFAS